MSDQPNITPAATTPPSTQSLDEILNQLEKATGTAPEISNAAPSATPATPAPEPPPVPAEAAPVMPAEPTSPPVETTPAVADTTPPDPAPVADLPPMNEVTSAPVMESTPEPAPVATLPENDIPVPPPATPSEPAPMVKEEPSLDMGTTVPVETPASEPETIPEVSTPEPMPTPEPVESTPIETPPEVPPSEPDVVPDPIKKSGGTGGKIIAGVIGVLLLAGAAGAGVFLTQQNQETRTPAVVQNTTSVAKIPTPSPLPSTGKIIGTICKDTRVKTPGELTAFNTDLSRSFEFTIASDVETFTLDLEPGTYTLYFKQEGSPATFGQTVYQECSKTSNNCIDHSLQPLAVTASNTTYALVCDASADITKVAKQ